MRRIAIFLLLSSLSFAQIVFAQGGADLSTQKLNDDVNTQSEKFRSAAGFFNSPTGGTGLYSIIGTLINALLSLLGVAFLVLVIYGGIVLFQARGEEGEVKKAQKIIEQGIIGLVVVLGAYAIAKFVLTTFTGQTLG